MTHSSFNDSLIPLRTDALIEERVRALIGRASLRQLWFLFLDEGEVQLPLLLPVDGLPGRPDYDGVHCVLSKIIELMEDIEATGVVLVWERFRSATLTAQDRAWVHALATQCVQLRVPLRAILLSHRTGVRWIAPDDYIAEPWPSL